MMSSRSLRLRLFLAGAVLAATATATKLPHGFYQSRLDSTGRSLTAQLSKPDYNLYHRKDDLLRKVEEIAAANKETFAVEMRNVSDGNYTVQMMVLTVDLGGIDSNKAPKTRYLMDFGEHARELISSELGLQLLNTLADPDAVRAVLGGGERGDALYHMVKEEVAFKILPMENTRGRDLLETEDRLCERKNGRGVDPNRNWEVDWGKKEKDYDPNEEYGGTKPFSEPEAQVVLDLAKTFKPHVWLNIHSGMEALFVPWDHLNTVPETAQEALTTIQTIHKEFFLDHKECVVGSGGKSVGYLAHGTATDYMFDKLKVPLPFTWEIFGDLKADYHDCFKMFNPITKEQFDATISVWLKSIFRLIELAPKHSVVEAELKAARSALHEQQQKAEQQQKQQPQQQQQQQKQQQEGPTGASSEPAAEQQPTMVIIVSNNRGVHSWGTWVVLALGVGGLVAVLVAAARYLKSSTSDSLSALGRKARTTNSPV